MRHVVLTNSQLHGPEYGMLRDFEDEIVRVTGAERFEAPMRNFPGFIGRRIAHGVRFASLRKFIPKVDYKLEADVLWVVLMGPENMSLDLFKNWNSRAGVKILYLFDTMESQLPTIRRLLRAARWNLTITSFPAAKSFLERETQRKWHAVPQGVKLERFKPAPLNEKLIDFCAYGRRLERIHEIVKRYCQQTGKHYDYTTAASLQPHLDPRDNYDIYAWHVNHSVFNFCWPVELTTARRVSTFSPITCRWFEAAASCSVILGRCPEDACFGELFGPGMVVPLDYTNGSESIRNYLDALWADRECHLKRAMERRSQFAQQWTWESRVREILRIISHSNE